jgi:hypothetical protein
MIQILSCVPALSATFENNYSTPITFPNTLIRRYYKLHSVLMTKYDIYRVSKFHMGLDLRSRPLFM